MEIEDTESDFVELDLLFTMYIDHYRDLRRQNQLRIKSKIDHTNKLLNIDEKNIGIKDIFNIM